MSNMLARYVTSQAYNNAFFKQKTAYEIVM